jgi:hypothetical protein
MPSLKRAKSVKQSNRTNHAAVTPGKSRFLEATVLALFGSVLVEAIVVAIGFHHTGLSIHALVLSAMLIIWFSCAYLAFTSGPPLVEDSNQAQEGEQRRWRARAGMLILPLLTASALLAWKLWQGDTNTVTFVLLGIVIAYGGLGNLTVYGSVPPDVCSNTGGTRNGRWFLTMLPAPAVLRAPSWQSRSRCR